MARKNRKKLNRERRLAAEARQQAAARIRRAAPHRAIAAKADAVLHQDRTALRFEAAWGSVHQLLVQANIPFTTRQRVRRLYETNLEWLPHMTDVGTQSFCVLLARQEWVRPLHDFRPPGGGWRRKRDALVLHLLAEYAVPRFLVNAVEVEPCWVARVPVEDEWAFSIVAYVGQGGSLRKAPADVMPAPITRRMAHEFLAAKADTPPVHALREVQVRAAGGDRRLAAALTRTRLRRLHGPDPLVGEPFVARLITWIAARPDLPTDRLDAVVGWFLDTQRAAVAAGGTLSLKGRTVRSVLRDAEIWLAAQVPEKPVLNPMGSGLSGAVFRGEDGAEWRFEELRTRVDLHLEGRAMSHCVAIYRSYVARGKTAIFSLRREGERRATVEVALATGQIVQAKGKANRRIGPTEASMLKSWAVMNRLTLRGQL